LSKEECDHKVVKEAFQFETVQLHDKKNVEEKRAKILNELSELNRLIEHQESLIERLEVELRDLKLTFTQVQAKFSNKYDSAEKGPLEGSGPVFEEPVVEGGAVFEELVVEGEPVFKVGGQVAEPLSEEVGVECQCEDSELSNKYMRMKAVPRAREESSIYKSPWIVYYRKRRRKSSDPKRDM